MGAENPSGSDKNTARCLEAWEESSCKAVSNVAFASIRMLPIPAEVFTLARNN